MVPTEKPRRLRPPMEGQPDFGANWYGLVDAVVRLHHGRDDRVFEILQSRGVDEKQLEQIKTDFSQNLQYPVLFTAMPLIDAVDYATYLIETTIGRYRFSVGAELCGGPIDVATISRKEGFQWLKRKTLGP